MARRKFIAALHAECTERGLHEPPPEVASAYAEAVGAMLQAVRERRRATNEALRRAWWSEFREAVATLLTVRRSLGLVEGEKRLYAGTRAARQAAARAVGENSVFSPMEPPPGFGAAKGKPN